MTAPTDTLAAGHPEFDPAALSGLCVVHLFTSVGPGTDRGRILDALAGATAAGCQVVTVAMLGHKADLGVLALCELAEPLRRLQTGLVQAGLEVSASYVSLTELSEYSGGVPPAAKLARLRPHLPPEGLEAFCFYPMSKRRDGKDNWYRLAYDERLRLMAEHGTSGRSFRGRVLQLVTGSTGLDDFEWGVTLFARTLDDLKACVYTMRYDEASARYADFGAFVTGLVRPPAEALELIGVAS